MCYSYRNLQSNIITCNYDLPVSNKLIHHSKPRLQVTDTLDNNKCFLPFSDHADNCYEL
jgi:hypothetical protein